MNGISDSVEAHRETGGSFALKEETMKYQRQPGDRTGHSSRATDCENCERVTVHAGLVRQGGSFWVCMDCKSIESVRDAIESGETAGRMDGQWNM